VSRVFGLDALRAFAILSVIYGHFVQHMPPGSVFQNLLLFNGVIGVELFFVLSGFLIGGIIIRQFDEGRFRTAAQVTTFWKRRWYRTLPAYFLFLAAAFLIEQPALDIAASYLVFAQNLFSPMPVFFGVSWSLAIEEWFYLLLPLPVAVLASLGASRRIAILGSLALLLAIGLLSSALTPFQDTWEGFDNHQRKMVLVRLSSLMFGVWMAYLKATRAATWALLSRCGALGALPVVAIHWLSFAAVSTAGWYLSSKAAQVTFFPLYSLACALLLPWLDSVREAPGIVRRAVTWLSDISYSLYLCHIPTIMLLDRYVLRVDWNDPGTKDSAYMVVYFAVCLAVAWLARVLWELPWLRLREKRNPERGDVKMFASD